MGLVQFLLPVIKKIKKSICRYQNLTITLFCPGSLSKNCHSKTNFINLLLNLKIFLQCLFSLLYVSSIHVHADPYFSIYFHFSENLYQHNISIQNTNISIPTATARLQFWIFFITLRYCSSNFRFCEHTSNKVYIWGVSLTCIYLLHFVKNKSPKQTRPKKIPKIPPKSLGAILPLICYKKGVCLDFATPKICFWESTKAEAVLQRLFSYKLLWVSISRHLSHRTV